MQLQKYYPLGLPMKIASNGEVISLNPEMTSFRHNLDTFSVNSGSPVFSDGDKSIIGVHVRGTGGRSQYEPCMLWSVGTEGKDYGAANTLDSISKYFKK